MVAVVANVPVKAFAKSNGQPLVGGRLYTYLSGTSTPATSWQDQNQVSANTNPIILDGRGECRLWLAPSLTYRLILRDETDALIWTADDVGSDSIAGSLANTTDPALGDALVAVVYPGVVGAVATTQHERNARELWIEDFGAVAGGTDSSGAINLAFAAAKLLQGAKVKAGPGTFNCLSELTAQASKIMLEGAGRGITTLSIRHNTVNGAGVRFANVAVPGLIENCGIRDLTLSFDVAPVPALQSTAMVHAEYVKGFSMRGVEVINGRCAALLKGCSDTDVETVQWKVSAGNETGRDAILIDNTDATFAGAGEIFGRRITVSDLTAIDSTFVAGANSYRFRAGVAVRSGSTVRVTGSTVQGARAGVVLDRSSAFAGQVLDDIKVDDNDLILLQRGVWTDNAGTGMSVNRLSIENNRHAGWLAVPNPADMVLLEAGATIANPKIIGNVSRECGSVGLNLLATMTGLTVTGNQLRGGNFAVNGIVVNGATGAAIAGNTIDNFQGGSGVLLSGVNSKVAVTGNTVTNGLEGVHVNLGTSDFEVWGNSLSGLSFPIADFSGAVYKRIQGRPIAFSAYLSAVQVTAVNGATKVNCNTEEFDTGSMYDNAANFRFQPLVAGLYLVEASVTVTPVSGPGTTFSIIRKNGANAKFGRFDASITGGNSFPASAIVEMNGTTDYLELWVSTNFAGNKNINSGAETTYFQATLIN